MTDDRANHDSPQQPATRGNLQCLSQPEKKQNNIPSTINDENDLSKESTDDNVDNDKKFQLPSWAVALISGGIAGTVAKSSVAPLERVKILYQTRTPHYPFTGIVSTLDRIVQKEGVPGLWRGNSATILRIFPYAGITTILLVARTDGASQ